MSVSNGPEVPTDDAAEEIDPFENSIAEKMQMARNVVIHCERMHNYGMKHSNEIKCIMNYTGVCEETILMADRSLRAAKTFRDWFEEKRIPEPDDYSFTFGSIRNIILELYTKKVQVATMDKVMKGLFNRPCLRIRYDESRVTKDIIRHGFTWKRLPGTKKSILVERTHQYLRKMEYITRMKAYRQAGRTIVYVDPYFYHYQLIVSPQHGLLHIGFHGLKTANVKFLDLWTKNRLISALPPNSVIVLKHEPKNQKALPTPFSTKENMINWLSDNKIPHDPNLHRADLYAMIKKFKQLKSLDNALDGILKSYGHDVVYRPQELKSLNYLEVIWPGGDPAHRCKSDKIVKIKEYTLEDWQKFESILINREETIYQEEILLEAVIDKILTLAKYGKLTPADLEECDNYRPDDYYSSIIVD